LQELIKKGDRIKHPHDGIVIVTKVESGRYGLLVQGKFDDDQAFTSMFPWEFEAVNKESWYCFSSVRVMELASGLKLGGVGLSGPSARTLEVYEEAWESTEETIRLEGSQVNEKVS